MKKVLFISTLLLMLVSCSKSIEERRSFVAFHRIVDADSLYAIGKTDEANSLLDEVLKQYNEIEHPTTIKRLRWAIFSDVDKEEGSLYYDYIFLYIAQIEAIAMKNSHEGNPLKKIETMKRLFTLAPDFDNVIEIYVNWEARAKTKKTDLTKIFTFDAAKNAYSPFEIKYNECMDKVQMSYGFAGDRWELPLYLYRAKWWMMNTLLIASDMELGYEKTFAYFDSILEYHGACFQEYTKVLVKSYMSFSGLSKYEYETDMGYDEFKTIVSDSDGWYTTWLYMTKGGTFLFERDIIPQSGGILVECGNLWVWNPTEITIPFLWNDDSVKLITIDGLETKEIILEKDNKKFWTTSSVNISKPLLCALLYSHEMGQYVPRVLDSKQYIKRNVIVREGEEDGYKKVVQYKDNREIEWRLYNLDGLAVCDSTGTHCQRVEITEDSTTTYYLGVDMLMRENKPAFDVRYHTDNYQHNYYDRQGRLYEKRVDDTIKYYKYTDSTRITIDCSFETNYTVVTTEFLCCSDSLYHPTKEVKVYNSWYNEETDQQFGDVVLIQHPIMNYAKKSDSLKWPYEQRWYDEEHRVSSIAYFDEYKVFQGGLRYIYKDNGKTIVYYYDNNNWLYRSETLFEDEE